MKKQEYLRKIRFWLALFIVGLVLSGVTAFPLQAEIKWCDAMLHANTLEPIAKATGLLPWIVRVHGAIADTNAKYPFMAYGTDWLAFAHLVIAIAFLGPYFDPVRNKWVITFGLIACAGVIPLAMIAGQVRGIPVGWRLVDCCFGVAGCIPLLICERLIAKIEDTDRTVR